MDFDWEFVRNFVPSVAPVFPEFCTEIYASLSGLSMVLAVLPSFLTCFVKNFISNLFSYFVRDVCVFPGFVLARVLDLFQELVQNFVTDFVPRFNLDWSRSLYRILPPAFPFLSRNFSCGFLGTYAELFHHFCSECNFML